MQLRALLGYSKQAISGISTKTRSPTSTVVSISIGCPPSWQTTSIPEVPPQVLPPLLKLNLNDGSPQRQSVSTDNIKMPVLSSTSSSWSAPNQIIARASE